MKILLAVSGGIDSMYMLHKAPELFPGALCCVAHCNFALRGEDSDGDEEFVKQACRELGMECFTARFDTLSHAAAKGISVEMAARELRYTWFAALMQEHGFDALATAHNANDNAETLILNLLRGSGTKGLRGIPEAPGLLRPLLATSREEIRRWMEAGGHAWREDRSNAEDFARRNKIRNRVFPVFREINPSFVRTLGEDMERIRQSDDIADDYYREAAARIVTQKAGCTEIRVPALLELKHWRYVLWRILEHAGLSAPTFGKLCALLEKYRSAPAGTVTLSGKTFESPTHLLRARRKLLVLIPR